MANPDHLAIIKKGVDVWNQWRLENPDIQPDLSNAELRYLCLNKIDLHAANLVKVDLYGASLRDADLHDANLHMAHLYRTDFCDANLQGAKLRGADLVKARLINAKLQNTDLRWVKMGDANLRGADLTESAVYAISAWDVILDHTTQLNLSITRDRTTTVTVDSLEVAQFIHMLLNYKQIRNVLNTVMDKGVLILGRFKDGGIDLLQAIADQLRQHGDYLPMIFDFDIPDTSDYTETVMTLASLSKFVIVELSGASVPQELQATVPHFQIPFVPIIEAQHEIHATFVDFFKRYDWVLRPIRFSNRDDLFARFPEEIIQRALDKINMLQSSNKQKMLEYYEIFPRKSKGEELVKVTEENMKALPFQEYRKSALLRARPLTEDDFKERNGIITTLEGLTTFRPGDYLAQGIKNEEWPISQKHFTRVYTSSSEPDEKGFSLYRPIQTHEEPLVSDILLSARPLTDDDFKQRNGIIETQEGPTPFQPGDYLAQGQDGEWPIPQQHFTSFYTPLSQSDEEGFAFYRTNETREAYRMPDAFIVQRTNGDTLTGKANDYLVRTKGKVWIIDRDIFERTHELC